MMVMVMMMKMLVVMGGAERWWLPTFIEALLCAKYKIHIAL